MLTKLGILVETFVLVSLITWVPVVVGAQMGSAFTGACGATGVSLLGSAIAYIRGKQDRHY